MKPRRVVLASGNAGKLREFSELLATSGFALLRQSDFNIDPPPETGVTFLDNALIKARNAARRAGLPAIADDSGIEVDALGGAPGVHSARFAGENADDPQPLIGEGTWEGHIIDARRGDGGFGYDPSFVPVGETRGLRPCPALR